MTVPVRDHSVGNTAARRSQGLLGRLLLRYSSSPVVTRMEHEIDRRGTIRRWG
jgi:hypothetical protein